jgi:hypothetical protein
VIRFPQDIWGNVGERQKMRELKRVEGTLKPSLKFDIYEGEERGL